MEPIVIGTHSCWATADLSRRRKEPHLVAGTRAGVLARDVYIACSCTLQLNLPQALMSLSCKTQLQPRHTPIAISFALKPVI